MIRVNLWWGGPNGVARRKPVNPASPADPAYNWDTYDRTVRYARAYKMEPIFTVLGTPAWANASAGWNVAPTNQSDLRAFVTAAAKRYSGTYKAADGTTIGRVREVDRLERAEQPGLSTAAVRPRGLEVGHAEPEDLRRDLQLRRQVREGGELLEQGCVRCHLAAREQPARDAQILRLAARLPARDEARGRHRVRRIRSSSRTTAIPSETPNTPPPPGKRGAPPTAITLGNFELFTKELARLYGNMRIWVTEYGYQTNPPDSFFGVSPAKQALYMKQAWAKLALNPKVDLMVWFLLRDEDRVGAGWQSGLYYVGGLQKPSRNAFLHLTD